MYLYHGETPIKIYRGNHDIPKIYHGDTLLCDENTNLPPWIKLTNLVSNGDFSDGTTGWALLRCANTATENGYLSFTLASGTNAIIGNDIHSDYWHAGHRYYIKIAFNNDASQLSPIQEFDYGAFTNAVNITNDTIPSGLSTVSTIYTATKNGCRLSVRSYIANATDVTRTGYVSCVDLTAAFGAGNEPTQGEIENWVAQFDNSWFDGSKMW